MRLALWGFQQDVDGAFILPAGSLKSEKRNPRMVKESQEKNHSYGNPSYSWQPKDAPGEYISCNPLRIYDIVIP